MKDTVTQDNLEAFFNGLIVFFRSNEFNVDYDLIRNILSETMNEMSDVSGEYNVYAGNSVSFRDLIRLEVEDEEFEKLVHTKVSPGQFSDIEAQFDEAGKRLMKYFKDHKDSELHPFVASETRNQPQAANSSITFRAD